MKICAVVVTFNRLKLLKQCITALKNQTHKLDKIIIINNCSTDNTEQFLNKLKDNDPCFEIVNLPENLGGAGGFEKGIRDAYYEGFDWIWVMDDDAEPANECLYNLVNQLTSDHSVGFLAPVIINKKSNNIQNHHHKLLDNSLTKESYISTELIKRNDRIEIDANAFVGPLFSRKAIEKVGFPRGDFFIWLDDTEYTCRVKNYFDAYLVTDAIIYHNDMVAKNNVVNDFWKYCYGNRNRWLWRHSTLKGSILIKGDLIMLAEDFKQFLKILLKKEWTGNRLLGLRCLKKTINYSLKNISGKFINPIEYHAQIKSK